MCSIAKSRDPRKGSTLVEFAISFTVLWLLLGGVFTFGYTFYVYNRLQTAVAGAAQYAAVSDYDSSNSAAYTTAIQNLVLYGDITAGTTPIVPGLTASNVQVLVTTDSSTVPRDVVVAVNDYSINTLFQRITLTGKPRAVVLFTGRWICSSC
jgi:Flp pilus assembly protein TadG